MRRFALSSLTAIFVGACTPPPPASNTPEPASTEPSTAQGGEGEAADEASLPAAEEVLASAVQAVGGKDKLDAIESYYSESIMEVPAQKLKATTKVWWQSGNFYSETDMPGVGVTKVWRNAEGTWSEDPINGKREITGAEARQMAWSNSLFLPADWQNYFSEAETVERRAPQDADAELIDVVLTSADGDELKLSFDAQTGLMREQHFTQESPMGEMPVHIQMEDYEEYGGFKTPTKQVMKMAVIEATTSVTKFEPNAQIDPSRFDPEAKGDKAGPSDMKAKGKNDEPGPSDMKSKPKKQG